MKLITPANVVKRYLIFILYLLMAVAQFGIPTSNNKQYNNFGKTTVFNRGSNQICRVLCLFVVRVRKRENC